MKNTFLILLGFLLSLQSFGQAYWPSSERREQLDEKYSSPLFRTQDATYFDLENNADALGALGYLNILDWLQGRVAGLQIRQFRNLRIPFLRNQPAAIYVDEMRMDSNYLNLLPVADIGLVKVIKGPFVGAWSAPGGVIAIYTLQGEEGDETE